MTLITHTPPGHTDESPSTTSRGVDTRGEVRLATLRLSRETSVALTLVSPEVTSIDHVALLTPSMMSRAESVAAADTTSLTGINTKDVIVNVSW